MRYLLLMLIVSLLGCFTPESEPLGKAQSALSQAVPQTILPVTSFTEHDLTEPYMQPSATTVLPIGTHVAHLNDLQLADPSYWAVQRLTQRTYAIFFNFYAATLYVGNHGVLLIDCGGSFGPLEVNVLLTAIQSVTSLPLKALVYSHGHSDHVANGVILKQMFPNLEIIGTRWLKEEIETYNFPIQPPTRTILLRNGHFLFEGKVFRIVTPVPVAHSTTDSYIITPDRVMHVVDFLHPGRLVMPNVSLSQNLDGYIKMLRHIAGEAGNYDYINVGHAQIAYQDDVETALEFYEDFYAAWTEVMTNELPFGIGHFIDPSSNNVHTWYKNFHDEASRLMFLHLADKWGHVRGFEIARDTAEKIWQTEFIHRFNGDPASLANVPDFTPIPPPWPYN